MKKFITINLITLLGLTACQSHSGYSYSNKNRDMIVVNKNQKRINTIDCKDFDDWYLDGHRVGKSFAKHKLEQLSYRVNYCQSTLTQSEMNRFKQNWDLGYQSGVGFATKTGKKGRKYRS